VVAAPYTPASQVMEGTLTAGETCGGKRPYGPRRGGKDGLEAMAAKKKIEDYGSMSRNQLLAALKIEV